MGCECRLAAGTPQSFWRQRPLRDRVGRCKTPSALALGPASSQVGFRVFPPHSCHQHERGTVQPAKGHLAPVATATPSTSIACAGGMGSLGSLMALWLKQQSSLHLFLLGRSGRAGPESVLGPIMSGSALVSMVRSNVASSEEAAYSAHAAGRTGAGTLQVRPLCQLKLSSLVSSIP